MEMKATGKLALFVGGIAYNKGRENKPGRK